mmetsp:Transcript_212/g.387  ORF Transcript_212/g.387 Transcript_212/m.387 type:complete len:235 (-) Transcript_212:480-1184(-)
MFIFTSTSRSLSFNSPPRLSTSPTSCCPSRVSLSDALESESPPGSTNFGSSPSLFKSPPPEPTKLPPRSSPERANSAFACCICGRNSRTRANNGDGSTQCDTDACPFNNRNTAREPCNDSKPPHPTSSSSRATFTAFSPSPSRSISPPYIQLRALPPPARSPLVFLREQRSLRQLCAGGALVFDWLAVLRDSECSRACASHSSNRRAGRESLFLIARDAFCDAPLFEEARICPP